MGNRSSVSTVSKRTPKDSGGRSITSIEKTEPAARTLPKLPLSALLLPPEAFSKDHLIERANTVNRSFRPKSADGEHVGPGRSYKPKQIDPAKHILQKMGARPGAMICSERLTDTILKVHREFAKFVGSSGLDSKVYAGIEQFIGPLQPGELQLRALAVFAIEQRAIDTRYLMQDRRLMPIAVLELFSAMSNPAFTGDEALSQQWRAAEVVADKLLSEIYGDRRTFRENLARILKRDESWPANDIEGIMKKVLQKQDER